MKQAGFGIIELSKKTIILPEAHAMNKSITQATQYVHNGTRKPDLDYSFVAKCFFR